jgi:hypothetical protein
MSEGSGGARRAVLRAVIWSLVGPGLFGMVGYAVKRRELEAFHVPGVFTLGKWPRVVFGIAFVWLVAALLMLTLQPLFHQADIAVLGTLGAGVLWYVAALPWRIRSGKAGVPEGSSDGAATVGAARQARQAP